MSPCFSDGWISFLWPTLNSSHVWFCVFCWLISLLCFAPHLTLSSCTWSLLPPAPVNIWFWVWLMRAMWFKPVPGWGATKSCLCLMCWNDLKHSPVPFVLDSCWWLQFNKSDMNPENSLSHFTWWHKSGHPSGGSLQAVPWVLLWVPISVGRSHWAIEI